MVKTCPICESTSLAKLHIHDRWQVPIMQCGACHHQFASEAKTDDEDDIFSTNFKRADLYFKLISNLNLAKVVDIGTPRDFLFLNKIHGKWPKCECIALDLYEKDHPPYVRLVHDFSDLEGLKADLLTAFHVLEHVQDLKEMISKIDSLSKYFIVEVPHCDNDMNTLCSSAAPHIHFFNQPSFETAFQNVNCQTMIRVGKDMPDRRSVLVAYRLPVSMNLEHVRLVNTLKNRGVPAIIDRVDKGIRRRVKRIIRPEAPRQSRSIEPQTILSNPGGYHQLAHVAFFSTQGSNAGDILLPVALRDLFLSQSGGVDWTSFHVHNAVTDEVVQKINTSQGVIIGGGGLFLRDTNKNDISGWQWPCSVEHLKAIKVPICVFAVGYNRFRNQEEFDDCFVDNLKVLAERAVFVGLRNNGSIEAVRSYLPAELQQKVRFQPCMTTLISMLYPDLFEGIESSANEKPFISLNCAFDRSGLRFGARKGEVLQDIANGVLQLMQKMDLGLKYYAHYDADFEMIDVLKELIPRFEICDLSQLSTQEIITAYQMPALALGMRGHAQMIPFGCQTPILSLVSHAKLQWFLDDIGQPDWAVDLREGNIASSIVDKGSDILSAKPKIIETIKYEQRRLWDISLINVKFFFDALNVKHLEAV